MKNALGDTVRLTAAGMAVGLPAAVGGAKLLSGQLYEVGPLDPPSLGIAVVVLSLTALLAGYLPARRAAGVDPATTLRSE